MKRLKIAIVSWYDSIVITREEPPHACPIMESIGYIQKLKDRILVIHLMPESKDISSAVHTSIPKGCVCQIRYLK